MVMEKNNIVYVFKCGDDIRIFKNEIDAKNEWTTVLNEMKTGYINGGLLKVEIMFINDFCDNKYFIYKRFGRLESACYFKTEIL